MIRFIALAKIPNQPESNLRKKPKKARILKKNTIKNKKK